MVALMLVLSLLSVSSSVWAAPMHPAIESARRARGEPCVAGCPSGVGDLWARVAAGHGAAASAPAAPAFRGPSQSFGGDTDNITDTVRVAVLLVQFPDAAFSGSTTEAGGYIRDMMTRADTLYRAMSYGRLNLAATVFDTLALTAGNGIATYGANNSEKTLIREALMRVDTWVNFGYYHAVTVLHAGTAEQLTGNTNDLAAQYVTDVTTYTDLQTGDTVTQGVILAAYGTTVSGVAVTMFGTFCHEFGHVLGLPDLYNTSVGTRGAGNWALMGTGNYQGDPQGDSPSWMSAWEREYLSWADTKVITTDTAPTLLKAEADSKIYKIYPLTSSATEYFLLEYRDPLPSGNDSAPGEGLLIWHVDNSVGSVTSNTVNTTDNNTSSSHCRVHLEAADGGRNTTIADLGDAGDPWPGFEGKTTFADNTTPNARAYSQSGARFSIKKIAMGADSVSFTASFTDTLSEFNTNAVVSVNPDTTVLLPTVSSSSDYKRISFKAADTDFSSTVGAGQASCTAVVQIENRKDSVAIYVKTNTETAVIEVLVPQAGTLTWTSSNVPAGFPATESGLALFKKLVLDVRFVDQSGTTLTDLSSGSQKYKYVVEYRFDATLLNQLVAIGADTNGFKLWSASGINSTYTQIDALTRVSSDSSSIHVFRSGELTTASAKAVGFAGGAFVTFPQACRIGRLLSPWPRASSTARSVRDWLLSIPAGRKAVRYVYDGTR